VFQVMTPYSLVNNTDVAEEHASCTYRLEEWHWISREDVPPKHRAISTLPCVTAPSSPSVMEHEEQASSARNDPVSRQLLKCLRNACSCLAAPLLSRYILPGRHVWGLPHSCWQMYAVRSMAARPHLSTV
jgi:hypothetical protein